MNEHTSGGTVEAGDVNAGPGWYEVIHPSGATTHIAYVYEDGSVYFPEGTQVLDRHEFEFAAARGNAHRMVRADLIDDARVLREAADEAAAIIADGDSAEVVAYVPGEVGRGGAIARRDELQEDPVRWLRSRADAILGGDDDE